MTPVPRPQSLTWGGDRLSHLLQQLLSILPPRVADKSATETVRKTVVVGDQLVEVWVFRRVFNPEKSVLFEILN